MESSQSTRVLIVDASFLLYQGVCDSLIATHYHVVAWAQEQNDTIAKCETENIDLVIVGPSFNPRACLELVRAARQKFETIQIILLNEHAGSDMFQEDAFHAGASACLLPPNSREELLAALESVENGTRLFSTAILSQTAPAPHLTEREIEILKYAADGKTDKEIAQTLQISVNTVRNHMQNILSKMEVHDRAAAVWRARFHGWI
ncbi:MAG: response regulator transcription factor [Chloroflexota bacterium]|nr:MAG: response regulator transcription factor [Chloroflexota bacterium]